MHKLTRRLLAAAGMAWLTAWAMATDHVGPREGPAPPRVKPLAARSVGVQPWETSSQAPWGSSRIGGADRRSFALSPDGRLLATQDAGGWQLELWDVATGKSLGRFGRLEDSVALAFSPDGKTLVMAGGSHHDLCPVELWDVARRRRVRGLDEEVNVTPFTAVAFAPNGQELALAAGPGPGRRGPDKPSISLWDVASGDEVRRLEGPTPAVAPDKAPRLDRYFDCLCFSPDGKSLALVSDRQVLLWEVATGQPRGLLGVLPPAHGRGPSDGRAASAINFSPDGRALAVGCEDGLVRLWDTVSGAEFLPLAGHEGAVEAVQHLADGKALVSVGGDKTVLSWPAAEARRGWRPGGNTLSEGALAALWGDLRGDDRLALHWATRTMAAFPAQALPLLREQLKPVPAINARRVARLVDDLGKDDFNERKRAAVELRKLGDLALPALRQANEKGYDVVQRRMLARLESQHPNREQVQALNGVQVLERLGTDEARRLLGELAKGAAESLLTRHAQAALDRLGKQAPPGDGARLESLWDGLASEDARKAWNALRALVARPDEAVPFLRDRLRPVAASNAWDDSPERIARLIADLDSDEFAVREKAAKGLSEFGKRAAPSLRKALDNSPSLEVTRRVEALLRDAAWPPLSPERLRAERALEALERIGTGEARQSLARLGKEARNRWLREAIAASQRRLGR